MPVLGEIVSRSRETISRCGILLVDGFHELSNNQWNALNPLDLFLRSDELTLQASATTRISVWLVEAFEAANLCSSLMYSSCR
jgi:uridine kinase